VILVTGATGTVTRRRANWRQASVQRGCSMSLQK
jgi:hypothetical protein